MEKKIKANQFPMPLATAFVGDTPNTRDNKQLFVRSWWLFRVAENSFPHFFFLKARANYVRFLWDVCD